MAREIVLDTETTGFKPEEGHRVIEIAAIEIVNLMPTGKHFRTLLNPERDIPADATRIHGFSNADVETAPLFAAMAPKLLEFLGDAPIIAHNAPFDFGFLDAELALAGLPPLDRARMIDTVPMARARFPGMPNSLDALCRRYGIDLSEHHAQRAARRAAAGAGVSGAARGATAGLGPRHCERRPAVGDRGAARADAATDHRAAGACRRARGVPGQAQGADLEARRVASTATTPAAARPA
jgi:DNA polymerase III epsilon subunit family exonuclease